MCLCISWIVIALLSWDNFIRWIDENKRRLVLRIWEWRCGLWDWEWRRRMAVVYVVCLVAYWLILRRRPQRRQVTYSISSLKWFSLLGHM